MARRIVLIDVSEDWLGLSENMPEVKSALSRLSADGVAVILFSQCDRAQLEPIRQALDLDDPFIVESGSAIFTPVVSNPFEETPQKALGDRDGDYFVIQLGCPYVQARAGLRVIANIISHPLKGLGDFTIPQLQRLASLSEDAAHRVKAREFSELFMTPKAVEPEALERAAQEMGFSVIWRTIEESRFSELLGAGASLTAAVKALLFAYAFTDETLEVAGLSQHQSALDSLRAGTQSVNTEIRFEQVLLPSILSGHWVAAMESLWT